MLFTLNTRNTTATQYLDAAWPYMAGVRLQYGDATLLQGICISQNPSKVEFVFWISRHNKPKETGARSHPLAHCDFVTGAVIFSGKTSWAERAPLLPCLSSEITRVFQHGLCFSATICIKGIGYGAILTCPSLWHVLYWKENSCH